MKNLRYVLAIMFLSLSFAGPADAAPRFMYECTMSDAKNSKGWISAKMAIVVQGDGSIKVIDNVILGVNKEPITATVVRDNNSRLIVKWLIDNAKADNGTSYKMQYRASNLQNIGAD